MNLNNISKREILDYEEFLDKVHDSNYKPLDKKNQDGSELENSGINKITREPRYDYVGYADAVFNNKSKIDVPGYRDKNGISDAGTIGTTFDTTTNESNSFILDMDEF